SSLGMFDISNKIIRAASTSVRANSCSNVQLLNHLISAAEQRRRHSKADRFSGFQVKCEFVFVWRLHRKVGGLFTFEDAVDIAGRPAVLVDEIRPVGDQ